MNKTTNNQQPTTNNQQLTTNNQQLTTNNQQLTTNNQQPFVDLRKYDQSWFDRGRTGWYILVWWFVQAIAFPLTPHPLNGLRCALLRLFGARIGQGVLIRPTARFTYPWKVSIGDYSWIGDDVVLYSLDYISIGEHSVISQKSYLCTGSHDMNDPAFGLKTASISIGNGVWIAADSFIGPGVEIGANAVIGARSSVFSNLPSGQVCWGTPCSAHYPRGRGVGGVGKRRDSGTSVRE